MNKFCLLIGGLLWSLLSEGQLFPKLDIYKVHLNDSDRYIVAEIIPLEKLPKSYPYKFYYWFSSSTIKTTQGGYSGELLNGGFSEYYGNKNLRQQGEFIAGLKDKDWRLWNEEGFLTKKESWRSGVKEGPFILYNEKGNIKQQGNYHLGRLNGKVISYFPKDSSNTVIYRGGSLRSTASPRSFIGRLHIFTRNSFTRTTSDSATHVNVKK